MTQRDTVTVAVLFMKPAFVTTPRNDMGGMLSKNSAMIWTDQVACPATASFVAAPHATRMTGYHFGGCICHCCLSTILPTLFATPRCPGYRRDLTGTPQILRAAVRLWHGRLSDTIPPCVRGITLTQCWALLRLPLTLCIVTRSIAPDQRTLVSCAMCNPVACADYNRLTTRRSVPDTEVLPVYFHSTRSFHSCVSSSFSMLQFKSNRCVSGDR